MVRLGTCCLGICYGYYGIDVGVFDSGNVSRESILVQGKRLLQECLSSRTNPSLESLQVVRPSRDQVRWKVPSPGWHKLNSNGAVKGVLGLASCGGVVRSDSGDWTIGYMKGRVSMRVCVWLGQWVSGNWWWRLIVWMRYRLFRKV
ncbi:hypothetical protein V6N12_023730 [Hibiscus sabdariffa]|uniref:Uncharacterized protein n=1 Tax=Hibiscus sabdariffa TaxID=183260 RepID=A0ABR2FYI7_9ROSI